MGQHAKLSASGSKRWMNCPASVRMSEGHPNVSSFFAMQGTAAHLLAEVCLKEGRNAADFVGSAIYVHPSDPEAEERLIDDGDPLYENWEKRLLNEGYSQFTVGEDGNGVEPWAVQMFLDAVRAHHQTHEEMFGSALRTETYLDMSWLHPKFGGTADANFLGGDDWVYLFDLKYGAGVMVEVLDNTQLKKYGVGILHEYPEAKGVRMWIVQPRKEHPDGPIRSVEYTRAELEEFARELVAAAERTEDPDAEPVAGDWCTFCPAMASCKAFKAMAQERAKIEFSRPPEPIEAPEDLEELARLAEWMPMLDALAKAVDGAIARHLHQGRKVRGFKLVRSKTNRKYGRPKDAEDGSYSKGDEVPEEEIVALLVKKGKLKKADLYQPPKLFTLAQMEKKSKEAKEAIKEITYKPEGALTVAAESDPREEVVPEIAPFDDTANLLEGME